jgi:hypothetical protein
MGDEWMDVTLSTAIEMLKAMNLRGDVLESGVASCQ